MDGRYLLNHIRDPVGVGDDHLLGLLAAQIGKFLQHFLRCVEKQGRLQIRVVKAFSRHDDPSVDLVRRVQKMHIAGGNHRLIKHFPQLYDLPVDFPQIVLCLNIRPVLIPQHEGIVADRLNFQIVIEVHQSGDLRLGPAV